MQNIPTLRRELAGLELSTFETPVTQSKFDLAVFMVERQGELGAYWVYRTDLFQKSTVLQIARRFEVLLRSAASEPDTRLSALEMFSEEEKQARQAERTQRKQSHHKKLVATEPQPMNIRSSYRANGE
jgi:tyrocidine synthetase-3